MFIKPRIWAVTLPTLQVWSAENSVLEKAEFTSQHLLLRCRVRFFIFQCGRAELSPQGRKLAKDSVWSNSIIKLGQTVEITIQLGQNALQGDLCKHHRLDARSNRCMNYVWNVHRETKNTFHKKVIRVDIN